MNTNTVGEKMEEEREATERNETQPVTGVSLPFPLTLPSSPRTDDH